MFNDAKKQLVVVVNDKTAVYGELLSGLVCMNDDKYDEEGNLMPDGIIGVKDGTVEVVIWTEKVYQANLPKISSDNRILFIGESKATKSINYSYMIIKQNTLMNCVTQFIVKALRELFRLFPINMLI